MEIVILGLVGIAAVVTGLLCWLWAESLLQTIRQLQGGGMRAGRKPGSPPAYGIWAGIGPLTRTPVVIIRGFTAEEVYAGIRLARERGVDVIVGRLD
jgi:hypothetical protein